LRNVRKYPVYIGIGDGSGYGKWPIRARVEEEERYSHVQANRKQP
jgi:hypothetical protein